ncbi:hypothetical protein [Oceanobacillus sp. CAU 1775]
MKKYIHATFFFFLLTALSGTWMRYYFISPSSTIDYDNVLHAHSHLALLGWIFIAAFILFLRTYWNKLTSKKQMYWILFSLFTSSLLMFFAFIFEGYGVFSIGLSTIHIFIEYWAAIYIMKQLKHIVIPIVAKRYIIGALLALIISSIGPYTLAATSMMGLKDHPIYEMAIYFYLHFQYNGWLSLFLIGMFVIYLSNHKLSFHTKLLNIGFWLYFIALFPSYLLSVLWADLGATVALFATIGSILQWVSVILILFALKDTIKPLRNRLAKLTWIMLIISFGLFLGKSTMELGLIFPELASLVNSTRSVIIGYLHLTLLGFISIFILTQYQMLDITKTTKYASVSFTVFFIGFLYNELLLFFQALSEWTALYTIPYYIESLVVAASILSIGVILMWFTVSKKQFQN